MISNSDRKEMDEKISLAIVRPFRHTPRENCRIPLQVYIVGKLTLEFDLRASISRSKLARNFKRIRAFYKISATQK
jgi:hypothetical protein